MSRGITNSWSPDFSYVGFSRSDHVSNLARSETIREDLCHGGYTSSDVPSTISFILSVGTRTQDEIRTHKVLFCVSVQKYSRESEL